jgi:hypothetical protein
LGYLAEEVGYPFNQLPMPAYVSLAGGVEGWGSMCGALVAPIQLIGMVAEGEQKSAMVNELLSFYTKHPFPEYQTGEFDLPKVAVNSTLCHVSVTTWMKESGMGPRGSAERKARCAGLVADICKFTAEMLNKHADGTFTAGEFTPPPIAGECMTCHGENAEPYAFGKESCTDCHDDHR